MRKANATETPYWIIEDKRKTDKTSRSPVKKLTIDIPTVRSNTNAKTPVNKPKKVSYSNFVSNYSRIHGINYKEALQSQEIKQLYKSFNRPQIGTEFFVKSSFEDKRRTYNPLLRKAGETIHVDTRNNESFYTPNDIKELSNDQNRLQISRGLYVDLKRSFLEAVRSDFNMNAYFKMTGHTQENFKPLSESITKTIFENALANRSKNFYSVTPFLELSVLSFSFTKYKTVLTQQDRQVIEATLSNEAPSIIDKLQSTSATNTPDEIKGCDTFFFNVSSLNGGYNLIPEIIDIKNSNGMFNYDIIFTDSNRQMDTITDFFNSDVGPAIVEKLFVGSASQKIAVLKTLRERNGSNFILQEQTNEHLGNLNLALKQYSGDQRALLEAFTEGNKEKLTVYYDMEQVTALQSGDYFKTNPTAKKIYQFSRQEGSDNDLSIFVLNESGNERKLQIRSGAFKKANLRKVVFIYEANATATSQDIPYDKLAETLPENSLEDIYIIASGQDEKLKKLARKKKPVVQTTSAEQTGTEEPATSSAPEQTGTEEPATSSAPEQGEGIRGGSLSDDLDEFRRAFNPVFKYLGKSGIEHVYKLSF